MRVKSISSVKSGNHLRGFARNQRLIMKLICCLLTLLVLQGARGAVVRRPPAFSKPLYSDSYLPAAMQVIFHAVEQLKHLEQDTGNTTRTNPEVTPASVSTTQDVQTTVQETVSATSTETMTKPDDQDPNEKEIEKEETNWQPNNSTNANKTNSDTVQRIQIIESLASTTEIHMEESSADYGESPEMHEETPESNYATPETNYESPENVYGTQETNQEVPEEYQEENTSLGIVMFTASSSENTSLPEEQRIGQSEPIMESNVPKKKEPTIDSIVEEIYEIVKPTHSDLLDEDVEPSGESKSSSGVPIEKAESIEEEEEETRFTLLGEKVAQVPRPSLSSYLRRGKVPPSASLQQLGGLYDAFSKDARKQGFGKYTGYSDEVLRILESSAEGGIAPQLKQILEKVLERNELTREDAKMKATEALKDLNNPSSNLNKDLRTLLPLRFSL